MAGSKAFMPIIMNRSRQVCSVGDTLGPDVGCCASVPASAAWNAQTSALACGRMRGAFFCRLLFAGSKLDALALFGASERRAGSWGPRALLMPCSRVQKEGSKTALENTFMAKVDTQTEPNSGSQVVPDCSRGENTARDPFERVRRVDRQKHRVAKMAAANSTDSFALVVGMGLAAGIGAAAFAAGAGGGKSKPPTAREPRTSDPMCAPAREIRFTFTFRPRNPGLGEFSALPDGLSLRASSPDLLDRIFSAAHTDETLGTRRGPGGVLSQQDRGCLVSQTCMTQSSSQTMS